MSASQGWLKLRCSEILREDSVVLVTTFDAIKAILRADPSVSPGDRARLLAQLREGPAKPDPVHAAVSESRLIRRSECARRLAVSVRCVDTWAKKGILKKRILPGHIRASGFLESAVSALIQGEGTTQ